MIDRNLLSLATGGQVKVAPAPPPTPKPLKPYYPREGTAAARAIAALKALQPGTRVSSKALAGMLGISQENLGKKLERAVDFGLIEFTLIYAKRGEWSLPMPPELAAKQDAVARRLVGDTERMIFGGGPT